MNAPFYSPETIAFEAVWAALVLVLCIWAKPGSLRIPPLPPTRGYLLVGLFAAAWCLLPLAFQTPLPRCQDEFSYLLAADTFASGRLTNPPHPLWESFETMHVLHQPGYMSKFPPAQGMALALGKKLFGHPIFGVKLSFIGACLGVFWMLSAWAPAAWAFLGALFFLLRFGGFHYWSQSYWGGCIAALGGALLYGGVGRLVRAPRARDSALLACGLALLANSRPFEGFMASIPAMGYVILSLRKMPWKTVRPCLLSGTIILVLVSGWMAYYNSRVAGDPFRLPHMVYDGAHRRAPFLVFLGASPPKEYRSEALRSFHEDWEYATYLDARSIRGFLDLSRLKAYAVWRSFFGILGLIPLLALPWALGLPRTRFILGTCLYMAAVFGLMTWFQPHYAAPISCLFVLLIVTGLRVLRVMRGRWGAAGKVAAPAIAVGLLLSPLAQFATELRAVRGMVERPRGVHLRPEIERDLSARPGRHLILVRYGPSHNVHAEWVYNGADLEGARILWAREMDEARNRRLIESCKDRQVWLLTEDGGRMHLEPYPALALRK